MLCTCVSAPTPYSMRSNAKYSTLYTPATVARATAGNYKIHQLPTVRLLFLRVLVNARATLVILLTGHALTYSTLSLYKRSTEGELSKYKLFTLCLLKSGTCVCRITRSPNYELFSVSVCKMLYSGPSVIPFLDQADEVVQHARLRLIQP